MTSPARARKASPAPCQYKDKSDKPNEAWRTQDGRHARKPAKTLRFRPRDVLPRHVLHCFERFLHEGNPQRAPWWVYTWKRDDPKAMLRRPYHCGSWRCPWCSRHEAAVTWRRISDACNGVGPDGWVFLVLTLDRNGTYSGERRWEHATAAFRDLGKMAEHMRLNLKRWFAREGWEQTGNRWVAVVEAHRSGWPHVNLLVYAPDLARWLQENQPARPDGHSDQCRCRDCRDAVLVRDELERAVTRAGFGVQSTAEPVKRGTDAVAGYITKLVAQQDRVASEVAKVTQAPLAAPERFRRLRSGKGFLPPRASDESVTGTLVRRREEADGTVTVLPLHRVAPEVLALVLVAVANEENAAHAVQRVRLLARRGPAWKLPEAREQVPRPVVRVRIPLRSVTVGSSSRPPTVSQLQV